MFKALNTFEPELKVGSTPKYSNSNSNYNYNYNYNFDLNDNKSKTNIGAPIPEIYGYNVITDQDKDILNQGTAKHIKAYFDKKQAEQEAASRTLLGTVENNIAAKKMESNYSINSRSFIIKFLIVLIFIWIVRDFVVCEKIA